MRLEEEEEERKGLVAVSYLASWAKMQADSITQYIRDPAPYGESANDITVSALMMRNADITV